MNASANTSTKFSCIVFLGILFFVVFNVLTLSQFVSAQEETPEPKSSLEQFFQALGAKIAGSGNDATSSALDELTEAEYQAAVPKFDAGSSDGVIGNLPELDLDGFDGKPAGNKRIEMLADFEEAVKQSNLHQRPLLVVFGAKWCSWCRKLESEFEKEAAGKILKQWVVVKVDVDEQPEIAQEMQANALPSLRVLGFDRAVVASKEGYVSIEELQSWLDESMSAADPSIQKILYHSGPVDDEESPKLIEFLANRSPSIRGAAQKRLQDSRQTTAEKVIETLRSGKLAQQLSALQILQSWKAPVNSIDPWQPETLRSESMQSLNDWLKVERASVPVAPTTEAIDETLSDEAANELLARLISSSGSNRTGLIAQGVRAGKGLLPLLHQRLANTGELDDSQRVTLRELNYQLLVGEKTRLENSRLFVVLASLDADSHRSAANRILSSATSQDQALVDHLSQDLDPLIREATVSKLQSLGALDDRERLTRLLSDKSPSVRTAVLRELSENPKDRMIETLIEYVDRETDENLLVYATKTMGQLSSQSGAEAALCKLAGNPSWRVRAAALDAFKETLENSSEFRIFLPGVNSSNQVSTAIADSVLKAAEDADSFVAERAVGLLPKVISKQSAPAIVAFLSKHPERLLEIEQAIDKDEREAVFAPLVDEATNWISSEEAEKVGLGAKVVGKLKPDALRDRIPSLLRSSDSATQIVALRATLSVLAKLREEQLAKALSIWERQSSKGKPEDVPKAWHVAAQSFLELPKPDGTDATASSNSSIAEANVRVVDGEIANATADTSFSTLDNFFGTDDSAPMDVSSDATAKDSPSLETDLGDVASKDDSSMVFDLFGISDTNSSEAPAESDTASRDVSTTFEQPSMVTALASQWLIDWQDQSKQNVHAPVVLKIAEAIRELKENPPNETQRNTGVLPWLNLAALAVGQIENVDLVMTDQTGTNARDAQWEGPELVDVLPWLPAKSRIELLSSTTIDWTELGNANTKALLNAATAIDDFSVADWVFRNADSAGLDESGLAMVEPFLLRALIGARADSIERWLPAAALNLKAKGTRGKEDIPNQHAAIAWLGERYRVAESDWSRALLLTTLSYLDHTVATESAVGLICDATEYDLGVRVALAISLSNENKRSVNRAVQWITHPVAEVQAAAFERLTKNSRQYAGEMANLGTVLANEPVNSLPGLWDVQRDLPVDALEVLAKSDVLTAWQAKVLLISAGSSADLKDVVEGHDEIEFTLPIVAALAKAERTDADALAFYTKASESLTANGEPAKLYSMIRNLKGDGVAAIRKQMRKHHGVNVLQ